MRKKQNQRIPVDRIVCPTLAYDFLTGEEHEGTCTEVACCYSCSKRKECKDNNGCRKGRLKGYPEKCRVYPLTFGEAKTIFIYIQLFQYRNDQMKRFITYQKEIRRYMENKRNDEKEKK